MFLQTMKIYWILIIINTYMHYVKAFDPLIGQINTYSNLVNEALIDANTNTLLTDAIINNPDDSSNTIISNMKSLDNLVHQLCPTLQNNMSSVLETLLYPIIFDDETNKTVVDIQMKMAHIDNMYFEYFIFYINNGSTLDNETLSKFIKRATSNNSKTDLRVILNSIYNRVIESSPDFLQLIRTASMNMPDTKQCGSDVSNQQRLYEIYNTLAVTEVKGYIMMIFSYALLTEKQNKSYADDMDDVSVRLLLRVQKYIDTVKQAMNETSKHFRRCDPYNHERDETFVELEGAIQMFIAHEPDLFEDGGCYSTCKYVKAGYVNGCYNSNEWCPHRTCRGDVVNCASSGWTRICELSSDSVRRYDWARDKFGRSFGKERTCMGSYKSIDSWTRWGVSCDVCMCTCYEKQGESSAIRTISLRPQLSNIQENMVVTGLKFISADKMIQIQIQEGKLLPGGRIEENSERWVQPETFLYDPKVEWGGGFFLVHENSTSTKLVNSEDYSYIRHAQKGLDLDDVMVPNGYVVTGIKFKHEWGNKSEDDWYKSRIWIVVHATKFDFNSGNLSSDEDSSYWITPYSQKNAPWPYRHGRYEIILYNTDNPEKINTETVPNGPANRFIEFRASNRFTDVGQATIPFFDAQAVTRSINVALSGIGLFYKNGGSSGGFVSFKTMNIDFSEYLDTELSENVIDEYKTNSSDISPLFK